MDIYERITGFPAERIVVMDTETTGLYEYVDEVLSVSFCDVYGNPIIDTLVRPEKNREWPEAQAVNGISPAMVANAPTQSQVSGMVSRFFDGNTLIVGYNVSFDMGFMRTCFGMPWSVPTFDVKDEFSKIHGVGWMNGRYKWSKLVECAAFYGYDHSDAHASMSDAIATAWCFRSLLMDNDYQMWHACDLAERYGRFTLSQTNSTRENLRRALGSMDSGKCAAVLRIGQITRGKNKGMPRYECMVGDSCIGTLRFGAESDVKSALGMSRDDPMPDDVKVEASMSAGSGGERCEVEVSANRFLDSMSTMTVGGQYGLPGVFRRIEQPKRGTPVSPPDYRAPIVGGFENESMKPKKKHTALKVAGIILLVLVVIALIQEAMSNIGFFIGLVALGLLLTFAFGKKKRR